MFGWQAGVAVAASAAILITLLLTIVFRRCFTSSKHDTNVRGTTTTTPPPPPQNRGITEFSPSQLITKTQITTRPNHHLFQRGSSKKPLFNWSNHPSLITDAFENGWSRFAFTNYASSPSTRSTLLPCTGQGNTQVEIAWEVGEESVEFMQKIRMNCGLKKLSSNSSSMAAKSVTKTALPLPGPPLGNSNSSVFPQEAYFEITILATGSSYDDKNMIDGEKIKLIHGFDGSKNTNHALEELKFGSRGGDKAVFMMSVGLTSSSLVPLKAPGSYRGSIGFNSDGSVYVDGMKLAFGSEKEEWGQREKVIGCGFNPLHKKVFFTMDSKLAHLINCKSEEFSSPLYPVIAANADVTIHVNLGQTRFAYEPANASRTPNPCFIGSTLSSPAAYEDSGELFSMGRIDSGWLNHSATKSSTNSDVYSWYGGSYNNNNRNGRIKAKETEGDDESEADLFEIVLDKSPKV